MLNRIIDILKKNNIAVWRVTEAKGSTAELYFVKKNLDIPRLKDMTQYIVTVFRDFEEGGVSFRGESKTIITPGMSDEDINDRVSNAYLAASFVKNKFYELPDAVCEKHVADKSELAGKDLQALVMEVANIIFSVDNAEDAFINSAEIFATKATRRIVASNGLDVSFDFSEVFGEFVTQCISPVDVEQFRQFSYDKVDAAAIRRKITDAIEDVRARARANTAPKAGNYNIILKGEQISELLGFYEARSSAVMIYPGYSKWELGDKVQGKDIKGDKINLSFTSNVPYSGEGIPMPDRKVLEDGELKLIHGSTRFCRYLGIEPTGEYDKAVLGLGSMAISDMRSEGVLEPISFSDFQMDEMDGHFKGEIRLALLYGKDGSVTELTGGSINGSLIDVQEQLRFSKESYEDMNYCGPMAVLIPNVAVAGE